MSKNVQSMSNKLNLHKKLIGADDTDEEDPQWCQRQSGLDVPAVKECGQAPETPQKCIERHLDHTLNVDFCERQFLRYDQGN